MNTLQSLIHWYNGVAPWRQQYRTVVWGYQDTMMTKFSDLPPAYVIKRTIRNADGAVVDERKELNRGGTS